MFSNCETEKIEKLDFQELLDKRYEKLINDGLTDCKLEAESEAENKVDSLIDKLLKKDLIDSIHFPDKPIRPDRPINIIE
jgi:hypothetical protein